MQRFYVVATEVLFDVQALLDKIVGDEVVGFFLPFMAGDQHAVAAVETAEALLRAVGHGTSDGPWCRSARVCTPGRRSSATCRRGSTASSRRSETRSTSPHLAAEAKAGEILITEAGQAALETSGLERRLAEGPRVDALVIAVDDVATSSTGAA